MTNMTPRLLAALVLGALVSSHAWAAEPVTPKLTDKLDRLLRQEMRSVQSAMGTIHTAMVTGQHEKVAENAQQVHDSFILQQSLTEQDRKDLKSAVPQGFIELDKRFHALSGQLAEAGKQEDTRKQRQLYDQMTGNCIQCHATYVSDRFPGVEYREQ
ncbi:hypothetical protein QQM79_08275 [Marinobacteraceae bacterium S3BR75-40.1]